MALLIFAEIINKKELCHGAKKVDDEGSCIAGGNINYRTDNDGKESCKKQGNTRWTIQVLKII